MVTEPGAGNSNLHCTSLDRGSQDHPEYVADGTVCPATVVDLGKLHNSTVLPEEGTGI